MPELIAGIDEVGTGAIAGPAVFGLVVLPKSWSSGLVRDSKKYSSSKYTAHRKRVRAFREAVAPAAKYWISVKASAQEIDAEGSGPVQRRCVSALIALARKMYPQAQIIIDGNVQYGDGIICIPKADVTVPAVSAASICAKIARDALMLDLDQVYPGYDFAKHKGYGTLAHLEALKILGPCPIHRMSVLRGFEWLPKMNETNA